MYSLGFRVRTSPVVRSTTSLDALVNVSLVRGSRCSPLSPSGTGVNFTWEEGVRGEGEGDEDLPQKPWRAEGRESSMECPYPAAVRTSCT